MVSRKELLRRAGMAAWQTLCSHWPTCNTITICCGSGFNAGDGYVLAQLAQQHGCQVRVWAIEDLANLAPEVAEQAVACQAMGITIEPYQGQSVVTSDVIVDAVLGVGLNRDLDGRYLQLVSAINAAQAPVFSLDAPTGVNADTGQILGAAVEADLTLTFILPKRGLFTDAGLQCAGRVLCDDLQVPAEYMQNIQSEATLLDAALFSHLLDPRKKNTHKGHFGHVLIIGGDYGMGGAVRMAAEAAMRVGAGLVSVATRPEHVNVVTGSRPELMCHSIAQAQELEPLLERANVVVIGPGLGSSPWSQQLYAAAIQTDKIKVIDADGLNLLSKQPHKLSNCILTPHPGEAKRLLGAKAELSRFDIAKQLHEAYGGVAILKGVGTIIQHQDSDLQSVCVAGNPGMATGGMGDILSGVLGGFLAQGINPDECSRLAVYLHAVAGDMAAKRGGQRGLMASDLFDYLRILSNPHTNDAV